jgi:pyridoxine 5-phosphate synthase
MIHLGVNIDHVATLRQARRAVEPDPVAAAVLALLGGADNITMHLREDRRHIQDRDLRVMREVVTQKLNLELAAVDPIIDLACMVKPDQATLVPERRQELTTEGGLDVVTHQSAVSKAMKRLQDAGIDVALFIDPDAKQIETAQQLGATAVEIQTARYSEAGTPQASLRELEALQRAAQHARDHGLQLHLGHGLNYINVRPLCGLAGLKEFNIGHSIVSRAVLVGMERAVREMKDAIQDASKA